MRAYAFLDRDGTVVREYPDEGWRGRTELDLLPGVGPALRAMQQAGFLLVVVTNQYLIGEGFLTEIEYDEQTRSLTQALVPYGVTLDEVLHCPHSRTAGCGCCKPATGLVDEAVRRRGPFDAARSFVVGDSTSDMALARALGLRGFLVGPTASAGPQMPTQSPAVLGHRQAAVGLPVPVGPESAADGVTRVVGLASLPRLL